jgi:glycosyltransferase involved in cell wall biosynthesis
MLHYQVIVDVSSRQQHRFRTAQEVRVIAAKPFVSVIICTRDRAASLARTLDSLVIASPHVKKRWELLVVDNGSSDGTADVIASFADRLPIRRVWQPVAGLSNARNAGVVEAKGDYILWTDDDVIVDERWLEAWFRAFRKHPDDAVFGGRAVPLYEEPPVPWFKANERYLTALLALRNRPDWKVISIDQLPWGLNYGIRADVQRTHLYDPALGVAPGRRRGGEEEAVLRSVLSNGETGHWVWDASVSHVIPIERQSASYILSYYRAAGFDVPIMGQPSGMRHQIGGAWYALKQLTKSLALYLLHGRERERAVRWLVLAALAQGSLLRYSGFKNV